MKHKRQVMVTLFAREGHFFSKNQNQNHHRQLEHNDFLWSIIIRPKKPQGHDSDCFDIRHTSSEPVRRNQPKPKGDWQFRAITQYEPSKDHRLLGQLMIGKIPLEVSHNEIMELLKDIAYPRKDAQHHENGINWIRTAIRHLQMTGIAEEFDVDEFLDHARDRAMVASHDGRPFTVNYTSRPM
ncbi:hypothetical protein N7533_005849 [Penicillium manginii]|jgi:hypothetical protein|uniref:uncharacterized protein n=1 Tax=Penicillium manginii TaxID=203109 RepID=UPI0025491641|nr:uncharacterized protein N7533_005849 [Penicillium manginii]KAJ5756306.1 hypothetical protein N7533_005849 [Penicillium manginii]